MTSSHEQCVKKTITTYLPGTHPDFEKYVNTMMMNIPENDSNGSAEISKWQAKLLADALRILRIGIDVDTCGITLFELEEMCVEKIAEEAFAFATYETATGEAKIIALDVYNFVKQIRLDIEREIQRHNRYNKLGKTEPTPCATISESSRTKIRNIFSDITIHCKFVSVGALLKAINVGIMQFLIWPERKRDRFAVVEELNLANDGSPK